MARKIVLLVGLEQLAGHIAPPEGYFCCSECSSLFPLEDRRVRIVRIDDECAEFIEEPEAIGEVEEIEYCPECFAKIRPAPAG